MVTDTENSSYVLKIFHMFVHLEDKSVWFVMGVCLFWVFLFGLLFAFVLLGVEIWVSLKISSLGIFFSPLFFSKMERHELDFHYCFICITGRLLGGIIVRTINICFRGAVISAYAVMVLHFTARSLGPVIGKCHTLCT